MTLILVDHNETTQALLGGSQWIYTWRNNLFNEPWVVVDTIQGTNSAVTYREFVDSETLCMLTLQGYVTILDSNNTSFELARQLNHLYRRRNDYISLC